MQRAEGDEDDQWDQAAAGMLYGSDADAVEGAEALELFHSASERLRGVKTLRVRLDGTVDTIDVAERAAFVPAGAAATSNEETSRSGSRRSRHPRVRVPPSHEDDGRVFLPDADGVIRPTYTSKYTGVSWHKYSACWMVQFRHHAKRVCVGYFHNEEAAAQAYDKAVSALGLQRPLNFPGPGQLQAIKKPPAVHAGDDSVAASAMLTLHAAGDDGSAAGAVPQRKRARAAAVKRQAAADDDDEYVEDEEEEDAAKSAPRRKPRRTKESDDAIDQHGRGGNGQLRPPVLVRPFPPPRAAPAVPGVAPMDHLHGSSAGDASAPQPYPSRAFPATFMAYAPGSMYYAPGPPQVTHDTNVTHTSASMGGPVVGQYSNGASGPSAAVHAHAMAQAQYYDAFRHMAQLHAAAAAAASGAETAAPSAAPSVPAAPQQAVYPRVPTPADAPMRSFAYPRAAHPNGARAPGMTPMFTLGTSVSPPPAGMMMHSYPRTDSVASLYAYVSSMPSSHTNISAMMQQALARPLGEATHRGSVDIMHSSPGQSVVPSMGMGMGSNPALSSSFSQIFMYDHDTAAEVRGATHAQPEGYVYFNNES